MNEVGEASYKFTHLELCKEDFENLMFMNPPASWDNEWLLNLCVQPLSSVAEQVIANSTAEKGAGATKIFENLQVQAKSSDRQSWFETRCNVAKPNVFYVSL